MTSFQSSELTELPVVENSQLFAQRAHSARYAPYVCMFWFEATSCDLSWMQRFSKRGARLHTNSARWFVSEQWGSTWCPGAPLIKNNQVSAAIRYVKASDSDAERPRGRKQMMIRYTVCQKAWPGIMTQTPASVMRRRQSVATSAGCTPTSGRLPDNAPQATELLWVPVRRARDGRARAARSQGPGTLRSGSPGLDLRVADGPGHRRLNASPGGRCGAARVWKGRWTCAAPGSARARASGSRRDPGPATPAARARSAPLRSDGCWSRRDGGPSGCGRGPGPGSDCAPGSPRDCAPGPGSCCACSSGARGQEP